jgi:hypothetical protein
MAQFSHELLLLVSLILFLTFPQRSNLSVSYLFILIPWSILCLVSPRSYCIYPLETQVLASKPNDDITPFDGIRFEV